MYKTPKFEETSIKSNSNYEGETIEMKVERIINNKEPIKDGAPIVYQSREEGVQAGYDIRTDRHEVALMAMDKVNASKQKTRADYIKELNDKKKGKTEEKEGKNGGTEPIQGTSGQQTEGAE